MAGALVTISPLPVSAIILSTDIVRVNLHASTTAVASRLVLSGTAPSSLVDPVNVAAALRRKLFTLA